MNNCDFNQGLLSFIDASPSPFHAVESMAQLLEAHGFTRLDERQKWQLEPGGKHYVLRNESAIVAFKVGHSQLCDSGIRLTGAHTDSPCLKLKPIAEINRHGYVQLGVEVYGGALLNPWFDRDLCLAGRVSYLDKSGELASTLINLSNPIGCIPSLAIHLDRDANKGRAINAQKDLPVLIQLASEDEDFCLDEFLLEHLTTQLNLPNVSKVLAHELSLYDAQQASLLGLKSEFIASARLDNLLSCYITCQSLIASDDQYCSVLVCNDHEEVGSASTSGAQGPFLKSVLQRLVGAQSNDPESFERVIRQSMMLSVDNAHGIHPNFADKHDGQHSPVLNAGPVIKINANQRYASNSHSVALFKSLCEKQQISYQSFVVRSDMACGSTIGPIAASEIGVDTVDVGVPTFAMHSIRELAGSEDSHVLSQVITAFFKR